MRDIRHNCATNIGIGVETLDANTTGSYNVAVKGLWEITQQQIITLVLDKSLIRKHNWNKKYA